MSNLVIAYPQISDNDYDWIQTIRKISDPMYFNIVRPHITLVFGTEKLSVEELSVHTRNKLISFRPITILLDSAKVVEDDSKKLFHTFLVPSEGYKEIIDLHDEFYTGKLENELRLDIPFIPHIGIGTSTNKTEMNELADDINAKDITIKGKLEKVSIVQYDGSKVMDCEEISLV